MKAYHHTVVEGVECEWPVDLKAAGRVVEWVKRRPEVFEADLEGMAAYFPHWVVAGDKRCKVCGGLLVPTGGAMRCVCCGKPGQVGGLVWLGDLPALARPEPQFSPRRAALREAGFGEAVVGESAYLLVPLLVKYPKEWPNRQPEVRYSARWLELVGLPVGSGAHHLVGRGTACLFGWGEWVAMPIHAVIQQRVVNHAASLLKVAAGMRPSAAFIGRVAH